MTLVDEWILEAQQDSTTGDRLKKLVRKGIKVARLMAANPATGSFALAEINRVYPQCQDIKLSLASNPNTPIRLLIKLSSELPIEVFQNPTFTANDSLAYQMPARALERILMEPYLSESFIKALLSHPNPDVSVSAELRLELHKLSTQHYLNVAPGELREIAKKGLTLAYLFAACDLTPEHWLQKLAQHSDRSVLKAIAANPNISPETFEKLAILFPNDILNNPSIDLILILNPRLIEYIPPVNIAGLLQQRNLPESFLLFCVNRLVKDLRTAAQFHVNLIGETVDNWQEVVRRSLKDTTLPWQKILPVSFFKGLMVDYPDILLGNLSFRRALAADRDLEIRLAMLLAEDSDEEVRSQLSQNPNAPKIALKKLAGDRLAVISLNVAKNPNTPPEVLEDMANGREDIYLKAIAANPSTPSSLLRWLASFSNSEIRKIVAANISAPKSILAKLANDKCAKVYSAVFSNPAIPRKWLVKAYFKRREDRDIRLAIAQNPNAPLEILQCLFRESDAAISYKALYNYKLAVSFASKVPYKDLTFPLLEVLINNPQTPSTCIQMILEDLLKRDRLRDLHSYPYENIPRNFPLLFKETMEAYGVKMRKWAEMLDLALSIPDILNKITANATPSADRLGILLSDRATPSLLANNYNSVSWLERYAVAQNPHTSDEILEHLLEDSNAIVIAATKANQNARRKLNVI